MHRTNLRLPLRLSALRKREACLITLLPCLAADASVPPPRNPTGDLPCNDHVPNPAPLNPVVLRFPISSTDTGLKPLQIRYHRR